MALNADTSEKDLHQRVCPNCSKVSSWDCIYCQYCGEYLEQEKVNMPGEKDASIQDIKTKVALSVIEEPNATAVVQSQIKVDSKEKIKTMGHDEEFLSIVGSFLYFVLFIGIIVVCIVLSTFALYFLLVI